MPPRRVERRISTRGDSFSVPRVSYSPAIPRMAVAIQGLSNTSRHALIGEDDLAVLDHVIDVQAVEALAEETVDEERVPARPTPLDLLDAIIEHWVIHLLSR